MPPTAGPTKYVTRLPVWNSALTRGTPAVSSPSSSGTIADCAPKCAPAGIPHTNASATRRPNDSAPAACSSGMAAVAGAHSASHTSIVRRAPSRVAIRPPTSARSASGAASAASTTVIRCGDPVVSSTNHGSATTVISVPSEEIASAATSAISDRRTIPPLWRAPQAAMMRAS